MRRLRRAISPVVAEVIMITLVVIIGVFFLSWTNHFSSSSKEKTDERYSDTVSCSQVMAKLDTLIIVKSSEMVNVFVTNKGSQRYPINRFEIYTSSGECIIPDHVSLKPGESRWFSLNCSGKLSLTSCDEFRSFAIISECLDKSIYFSKSLEDKGEICKYEGTLI